MPKLKKYEIDAVSRQIKDKLNAAHKPPSKEAIKAMAREKFANQLSEAENLLSEYKKAKERLDQIKEELKVYRYSENFEDYENAAISIIRKEVVREFDSQAIEDMVVVYSNLDLEEIIEKVVTYFSDAK